MANKTLEYLLTIKDEATKSLQNFGKEAQNIGKNLDNVGRSISDAGVGFAKIGAAGVAGLGLATKSAMDFDSQLRNIQSISKMTEAELLFVFRPGIIFRTYLAYYRHIKFTVQKVIRFNLNNITDA